METKVFEIINVVLTNNKRPKANKIERNMNLRNDLGLDSIMLAELTVRIEDAFGIDIFENGIINTVGEIYDRLKE